jgi:hypothetical protein
MKRPEPINASLKEFCDFLRRNLQNLEPSGGSGVNLTFPDFDLMPQDYLNYADEALSSLTDANRINCIGHLKRAIECECETLLVVMNLRKKARDLNFPQKLEFINTLQLMPSRSLGELNRIRNKVEHEFSTPEVEDLTVYFDLVAGFIAAVDGAMFMLATSAESEWVSDFDDLSKPSFNSKYDFGNSTVCFSFFDGKREYIHKCESSDWENFRTELGLMFLLIRAESLVSGDYVVERLPK